MDREDKLERGVERQSMLDIHKSNGSKLGWKRHHASHMQGIRKRERNELNKSFYALSKELDEAISSISESNVETDNVFDYEGEIIFETLAGGISFKISDDNSISISTILNENGKANYKVENAKLDESTKKQLYNDLREEINSIANELDIEFKQILARHGLKPTS